MFYVHLLEHGNISIGNDPSFPGSIDRLMFYDSDRKSVEDYYKFSPVNITFPIPINKTNDFDEYVWRFSSRDECDNNIFIDSDDYSESEYNEENDNNYEIENSESEDENSFFK